MASQKTAPALLALRRVLLSAQAIAIVLTLIFVKLLHAFEHTHRGHLTVLWTYARLHRLIDPVIRQGQPETSVLVIDTSDLPLEAPREGTPPGEEPTSRDELLKRLRILLAHKPAAIGIDIDFSPESIKGSSQPKPKSQEDTRFFAAIHQLREETGVPIYLGVHSQLGNTRAPLGLPEDNELAATIPVANENTIYMPLGIPTEKNLGGKEKAPVHCIDIDRKLFTATLVYRMAKKIPEEKRPQPPTWLKWIRNEHSEANTEGVHYPAVLVNYSKLEYLQAATRDYRTPEKVHGKFVLLGDATKPSNPRDKFDIPGHGSVPGVFLHASALYSLLDEPVYELKLPVRVGIDLFFAMLVTALIAAHQFKHRSENHGDPEKPRKLSLFKLLEILGFLLAADDHHTESRGLTLHEKLEILGFAIVAIVFLLLASTLAAWFRILYLDAVLAASGLLAHGIAGVISHRILHHSQSILRRIFSGDHVSKDAGDSHESTTSPTKTEHGDESQAGTTDDTSLEPEPEGPGEGRVAEPQPSATAETPESVAAPDRGGSA